MTNHHLDPEMMDINKHLLQIDLAVYDELQWNKIMHEIELVQKFKDDINFEPMSCQERLSHAIHVSKVTIYPDPKDSKPTSIRKDIFESHDARVSQKHKDNEYHNKF